MLINQAGDGGGREEHMSELFGEVLKYTYAWDILPKEERQAWGFGGKKNDNKQPPLPPFMFQLPHTHPS